MPDGIEGPPIRHYTFPDRWWQANIFIDLDGRPLPDISSFDCDIATPHFVAEGVLCSIDLKLDVLVRADARTYTVKDQDHFEEALREGWIDADERHGAERGLEELVGLIDDGRLLEFLEDVYPLCDVSDAGAVEVPPAGVPERDTRPAVVARAPLKRRRRRSRPRS
jgi:hypothetical protein